jgi:ribulose 1,5-bisphosphate synthetase/thiazole synthase
MAPATTDAPPVFPTPEEFVQKRGGFDYIVVGGGTAGLVVAARCASSHHFLNVHELSLI